jgi:hypothetical protein
MAGSKTRTDATSPTPDASGRERRHWPRVPAEKLARVGARLATGADVRLIDLSRGGARIETDRRMLPNSSVALKLVAADSTFLITGRVVRSRVIRLAAGGLGYDVAVSFNEPLQQFADLPQAGEVVPGEPAQPGVGHDPSDAAVAAMAAAGATVAAAAAALPAGGVTTPHVGAGPFDSPDGASLGAAEAGDDDWPVAMIHVQATIDQTAEELIDLFDESNW